MSKCDLKRPLILLLFRYLFLLVGIGGVAPVFSLPEWADGRLIQLFMGADVGVINVAADELASNWNLDTRLINSSTCPATDDGKSVSMLNGR